MWCRVCVAIISPIFAWTPLITTFAEPFSVTVISVTDGDTITVLCGGRQLKIRLANIDCPEKSQEFGQRAKQFTADLVIGKTVIVESRVRNFTVPFAHILAKAFAFF